MYICFEYSPLGVTSPAAPDQKYTGSDYQLCVHRRDVTGPAYPHIWEQGDPKSYSFFAGRIAGELKRDAFPSGHAVSIRDVSDWSMTPEPDGSWLAAKFDRETDKLSFASDPYLLQRWYFTRQNNSWFITNSLIYLKELLGDKLSVNEEAIPYMLRWGYLPDDLTPLTTVKSMRGCEVLELHGSYHLLGQRRQPFYLRSTSSEEYTADDIATILRQAVAKELEGVDSITLPLSGGMDSRFLLGCALEVLPKDKIKTLTFGHRNSLDYRIGTGLSQFCGVHNIALGIDDHSVSDLLSVGFQNAEGIYSAFPNHPAIELENVLREEPLVLSGYVGDVVFGSYDLSQDDQNALSGDPDYLLTLIHNTADIEKPSEWFSLLANNNSDPLQIGDEFKKIEGSPQDRFASWVWMNHQQKRTNFAVELYRSNTFYLTPFVHAKVMETAYSLTDKQRSGEALFFDAMQKAFPRLWEYPSKNTYGFPPSKKNSFQSLAVRAFRKGMSEMDQLLGTFTGKIYYHHPRNNYEHPRELMQKRHRGYVIEALTRLRERSAFNADRITDLIDRYYRKKPVNTYLLYGLLTIDLWYQHYET